MLVRCGGTVIEIGRRQLLVVLSACVVLLLVCLYCLTLIYGYRHNADTVQPTPLDHQLMMQRRQQRRPVYTDNDQLQQQHNKDDHNAAATHQQGLCF